MGNSLGKIPWLVLDIILDLLHLEDAKNLMVCDNRLRDMISANRPFWERHAMRLYEIDPALFMRLKSHHLFDQDALVQLVSAAHSTYLATVGNILAANSEDTEHAMGRKIVTLAIDEEACLLAIHLDGNLVQIHSLLRLGDPPLRSVRLGAIHHMILHGNILFYRHTHCPATYHTDVYNWKIGLEMASLTPGSDDIGAFRLKFSNRFLIAYDWPNHCSLAYQLDDVGYRLHPIRVPLPAAIRLRDHATRGNLLLVLLEVDPSMHVYHEIDILKNQVIRVLFVASPIFLYAPKIAYPYILVTQANCRSQAHLGLDSHARSPFYVYGPRIFIPGSNGLVLGADPIHSSGGIKGVSFRGQFVFIANGNNDHTKIIFVGDPSVPFQPTDYAQHVYRNGPCAPGIVSFGLSVIFARGSVLVFRRYFENGDVFM